MAEHEATFHWEAGREPLVAETSYPEGDPLLPEALRGQIEQLVAQHLAGMRVRIGFTLKLTAESPVTIAQVSSAISRGVWTVKSATKPLTETCLIGSQSLNGYFSVWMQAHPPRGDVVPS